MGFNSTIMDKYTECIDCADGILKPTIAGRCKNYHYSIYRKKVMLENQKEKQKVRTLEHIPTNKKMLIDNGKIEDTELQLFYKVKMQLNEPRCVECGAYKPELKQWTKGWQSCQAHLLPKRHFKSIQTHPLVSMVLGSGFSGLCLDHDIYDSSWEKAGKMKIWPEVIRRFKILYPLIDQKEHQFIPDILLKEIA